MLVAGSRPLGGYQTLFFRSALAAQNRTLFSRTKKLGKGTSPILRFAPSPTGHLHLGGLRTALFNHLYARKNKGKWILRIEDTDQTRLVPGAVESMQEILAWAGLNYDEGPDRPGENGGSYIQSERLEIYQKYAEKLLNEGKAYRDFRPPREDGGNGLRRIKSKAITEEYLPPDEEQSARLIKEGQQFVIRLIRPQRETKHVDLVYGQLTFPYDEMVDDPVLVKSDGWPTYHLANVVDDAEMGITHVLRGEEWLPSLPLHLALYESLGLPPPSFAHLPLLINPDGTKLSKRHADVHVESYRTQGLEPEAIANFVGLMGYNWHEGETFRNENPEAQDRSETFSMHDMIDRFSLDRISHSRASPNFSKLYYLNRQHLLKKLHPDEGDPDKRDELVRRIRDLLRQRWTDEDGTGRFTVERAGLIADILSLRADRVASLVNDSAIFFEEPDWSSEEARKARDVLGSHEMMNVIGRVTGLLEEMHPRDVERVPRMEAAIAGLAQKLEVEQEGVTSIQSALAPDEKDGKGENKERKKEKGKGRSRLMRPLRFALMGGRAGPTVVESLSVLGQMGSLRRLENAMKALENEVDR